MQQNADCDVSPSHVFPLSVVLYRTYIPKDTSKNMKKVSIIVKVYNKVSWFTHSGNCAIVKHIFKLKHLSIVLLTFDWSETQFEPPHGVVL